MQKQSQKIKNNKKTIKRQQDFPDGQSAVVPPDSIPNSEVKRSDADGSVGLPHVRVGHHQGFIRPPANCKVAGVFDFGILSSYLIEKVIKYFKKHFMNDLEKWYFEGGYVDILNFNN